MAPPKGQLDPDTLPRSLWHEKNHGAAGAERVLCPCWGGCMGWSMTVLRAQPPAWTCRRSVFCYTLSPWGGTLQ